mmetsp:Transcript_64749/g.166611  ORF Transcript_64749/g.166611 Transcript_64749/m.166611 type:complete len:262 (+) Transcript_64749:683-1468(+)
MAVHHSWPWLSWGALPRYMQSRPSSWKATKPEAPAAAGTTPSSNGTSMQCENDPSSNRRAQSRAWSRTTSSCFRLGEAREDLVGPMCWPFAKCACACPTASRLSLHGLVCLSYSQAGVTRFIHVAPCLDWVSSGAKRIGQGCGLVCHICLNLNAYTLAQTSFLRTPKTLLERSGVIASDSATLGRSSPFCGSLMRGIPFSARCCENQISSVDQHSWPTDWMRSSKNSRRYMAPRKASRTSTACGCRLYEAVSAERTVTREP